jgi:hypothetical protein
VTTASKSVVRSRPHTAGGPIRTHRGAEDLGTDEFHQRSESALVCGELGLQYDRIDAGNKFGVTKTPEYRALNPNGLIPTIEDGDFQLWESNVIVRYLAQKGEHDRLCPADIRTRFDAERWMDWQATVFWPALGPLFIQLIRTPPANRDATVISRASMLVFPIVPFSPVSLPMVSTHQTTPALSGCRLTPLS